ncbi:MAG: hypothetical protein ACI8SR_002637 [Oceanicoccus sp.]
MTADSLKIDGLMKLPSEPTINVNSSSPSQPPTQGTQQASASASGQAVPKSIQALINTWANVESSQILSDKQNLQVLNQLALLIGSQPKAPTISQSQIPHSGISEKLNIANLAQSLGNDAALTDSLKLVLIKLLSVKGPISILSDRPLPANSQVLLGQTPEGRLTIQREQNPALLNQFRSQFSSQNFSLKPIPLMTTHERSTQDARTGFTFTSLPNTTLKSTLPLAAHTLQQALINSGQNFESKLTQLLQSQTAGAMQAPQKQLNQSSTTNSSMSTSMHSKISQVEQSIQKWVSQFQQKINHSNNAAGTASQLSTASHTSHQTLTTTTTLLNDIQNSLSPKETNTTQTSELKHDHKSWLIQNQNQLLEQLGKQLLQRKDRFIPNWSSTLTQGAHPGASVKTFQDLTQWLTLLMMPKASTDNQGESLWPKPLAVQPQLQQTLSALLNSFNQNDSETTLLRQLLSITQNLSKLTHDQIQNRFLQAQDNSQFQLSLPYIHQNQLQWCEFECKQHAQPNNESEKTNGWHLILRFAQQTDQAFAIESHLKQEQLAVTLWASESQQLKYLHENIPLIKTKLEQAGFKVDSVSSKHGAPKQLHQPIQQSLIDVHT